MIKKHMQSWRGAVAASWRVSKPDRWMVSDVRRLSRRRNAQQGGKVPKHEIRSLPTRSAGVIRYCDTRSKRN